ncbi:MAG: SufS family cysteine desulfurase [Slackia sp.]|nr:SufS family cysteine desulfurase [Slackia sp.]
MQRITPEAARDIAANPFKSSFPLLAANPDLAFLDSAATAQRPRCVIDEQARFYETLNANALRGLYDLSVRATEAIEAARAKVARHIGAPDSREVVVCRNASEALNIAARSFAGEILRAGDEVCVTTMEHHSNLVPWQRICRETGAKLVFLNCDAEGRITSEEMDAKIGPATRIVAAAHVSNVLGVENPVAEMAKRVHEYGGYMIVDGAQSVPHLDIDVEALGCDFFAFSAHKAYGPFGIGFLWGKMALLESAAPFLTGGEMVESVAFDSAVWAPVPEKFEAGTQDGAGIHAAGIAIDYLESIGSAAVRSRESALVSAAADMLSQLGFVDIVGPADARCRHGLISFNVRGVHPHDVASILDAHHVAIRAGYHCAQPLLDSLGIGACCRASFSFYNDESDIAALERGLAAVERMFHG